MPAAFPSLTQINGVSATSTDLSPLAFAGFAHFTAMQIREGGVRGLDLHLDRLRNASLAFFGRAMPDDQVTAFLRKAVGDSPAAMSLTATMYSRTGEFTAAGADDDPAILVRTAPAYDGPAGPLRLMPVAHERPFVTIKQVGESAKTVFLRQAVDQGFDDAAFLDRSGRLSEATIWNLVFWDGTAVVWPNADMLPGVTMQIIRRQLDKAGIPQRTVPVTLESVRGLKAAAVMNSWSPGIAVGSIGPAVLADARPLIAILHEAYAREPLTPFD